MSTSSSTELPHDASAESPASVSRAQTPLYQQPGPKLFFAGIAFGVFSVYSTRRAFLRRQLQAPPPPPQTLVHPPHAQFNPSVQARQSASDSVLSQGQPASQAAPGYASAVAEAGQTFTHAGTATSGAAAESNSAAKGFQHSNMFMALEALHLATINVLSWSMAAAGGVLWKLDIRSVDEMRQTVRGSLGVDGTGRSEQQLEEELEEWFVDVLSRKEDKDKFRERAKDLRDQDRSP